MKRVFKLLIFIHFSEILLYETDMLCMCPRRKMETSCKTYFMSGKIKELKKKKKKGVFQNW